MRINRPVLRKLRIIGFEADPSQVADQRIEPDIENVRGIIRKRNAPFQRGTADGQVFEAAFHERDDFVAAAFRANEHRIFCVQVEEPVLECG